MNGQSANIAACPLALTAHILLDPKRSTSRPIGYAARNAAAPAQVRPSPTWAARSPTTWVKNTADPVRKVPSAVANSSDWVASRRDRGVGGMSRRSQDPSRDMHVFDQGHPPTSSDLSAVCVLAT